MTYEKFLTTSLSKCSRQSERSLKSEGPYPAIADEIWQANVIPDYGQAILTISSARQERMTGEQSTEIPTFAENLAGEILKASNINLDKSSELYLLFCESTVRMYLEYTQRRMALNDEARSFQGLLPAALVNPTPQTSKAPGKLITEVVEVFCQEMVAGGNWTPKTESEYRAAYSLLIKVIPDMPITLVDYPAAQEFKATLLKLPSNMNKKPLYRDKPISAVLAMKIPKEDLLSISKVNSYLIRISALFNWATKNGYVQLNPFSGQKVKEKVAGHQKRHPFSVSDLQMLFSSRNIRRASISIPITTGFHCWGYSRAQNRGAMPASP